MAKSYDFHVNMFGYGDTPEEAWENCKEQFDIEKEGLPAFEVVDEED